MDTPRRRAALSLALAALCAAAAPASGQHLTRPWLDWRTLETENFTFHYTRDMEEWARVAAARMESVREEVGRLVGNVVDRRVQVLVDDPLNASNGYALPLLQQPTIVLWPTPPSPRLTIGNYRDWPELLTVHEYAHIAHLGFPWRNPPRRLFWSLLPIGVGPVARHSPRWAVEGYATFIEGRVTGSGRPHNAWRAAVLRQWAIEGRLPTYRQLSSWAAYQGRSFAYLGGSAFLEWLGDREGDSTLVHVMAPPRRATEPQLRPSVRRRLR